MIYCVQNFHVCQFIRQVSDKDLWIEVGEICLIMVIPQSDQLTTIYQNCMFDNTVAIYKYYWFLSILDIFVKQGKTQMNVWEIMIHMVAYAWYPVNYFRLTARESDSDKHAYSRPDHFVGTVGSASRNFLCFLLYITSSI